MKDGRWNKTLKRKYLIQKKNKTQIKTTKYLEGIKSTENYTYCET